MGERTGRPRGRPPGAKNKRTVAVEAAAKVVAAAISESLPESFAGDAHALLMTVYKDPSQDMELRLDAAKAAIRYEKPALAAIDHTGEFTVIRDISDEPLSDDAWAEQHSTAH
jgi:hypothetical protein